MASYLDIDSTYRNRNTWPKPGEFEVLVSISGRKSAMNADDPVALASPTLAWTSSLFNTTSLGVNNIQGLITNVGVGNATSKAIITFTSSIGTLQQSENYYKGSTWGCITNPTQYAKVTSYKYLGNDRGQVTLDNPVTVATGYTFDMLDPTDLTDPANPIFFLPMGSDDPGAYINYILYNETINQFRTINSYDNTTGLLQVNAALSPVIGWLPTHNYSIRKQPPVLVSIAVIGSTNTMVVFGTGAGMVDNLYNGWFIRTPRTIYDNNTISPQNEQRRIISYDGSNTTATVSPPFTTTTMGSIVELLQFTHDNMYPFPFRATLQQEIPTYSIRLNRLILPNRILKVHGGGKTAFHNYVYVELSSIDNPNSYIIFSNNPNAVRALFTASITNIANIDQSDYVVMYGDDITQTVRFRLDTNFKFRVIMPTGETFETLLSDNMSPLEPNPKVQIRALFEFNHWY
jgi:hypothetical protein